MWINSSAFLVLEKILSWPLTEFLSQRLCKFCKKSTCSLDLPPDFIYAFLQRTPRPPDCEKSCISKTICFLFQGVAQSCMTVKLVKYFLASINKLTFWKFPTVSGHLRHCLVFVTSCPLSPGGALLTVSILHVYWNAINAVVCDITWCFSHNLP